MREAGVEAEIAIPRASPLAARLEEKGWARPLLASGRGAANFLQDVASLHDMLSRERFDVVHSHSSHDHLIAAAALSGSSGISAGRPLVRSFHHESGFRPILSRWGRLRASGFAFSNSALEQAFVSRFGPRAPSARFSPVVDPELFHPGPDGREARREFGVPEDSFVVGTVGKMAPGRGHDAAIRVLAGTTDARITLLHVGKGEAKERLWELARAAGVGERNFGTGYQEERLPTLYRAMEAFLFTASGADQGHRAVAEAMASGIPVVALDIPGIRDFDLVKGAGFVARNEPEASEALDFLASHPAERAAIAAAARLASVRFGGPVFAAGARDFYERVLDFWKKTRGRDVSTLREKHE